MFTLTRVHLIRLVLFCGLSLLLLQSRATAQILVPIPPEGALEVNLAESSSFYKDPTASLTLQAIKDKEFLPAQGLTLIKYKGAIWIKVRLSLASASPRSLLLSHPWPQTDHIAIFHRIEADGSIVALGEQGDRASHSLQGPHGLYPTFPLTLSPGEHTLFIRIETAASVHWDLILTDLHTAATHSSETLGIMTWFFGIFTAMFAYNFFLYLRLRHLNFLIYCIYFAAFIVAQVILSGMGSYLFAQRSFYSFLVNEGIIWSAEIAAVAGSLFTLRFLKMRKTQPRLAKAMMACYPFSAFNILLSFWNFPLASSLIILTNTYTTALELTGGIRACRAQQSQAYYFTIAWGLLILGNLAFVANNIGLLPLSSHARWGLMVGGSLEALLMSLALGDRMLSINTRRKIAEKTLEMEGHARLKLAATVAHKLNNPLNAMQLASENLEAESKNLHIIAKNLFSDQDPDDPDTIRLMKTFNDFFSSSEQSLTILRNGIQRSTALIDEVRTISGVDGTMSGQTSLQSLYPQLQARLQEHLKQAEWGRLTFTPWPDVELPINPHILLNSLEAILKLGLDYSSEGLCFSFECQEPGRYMARLDGKLQLDPTALKAAEHHIATLLGKAPGDLKLSCDGKTLLVELS